MDHKGTVRIQTERCVLRKFVMEDEEKLWENYASDEKVRTYMGFADYTARDGCKQFIDWHVRFCKSPEVYDWCVEFEGEPIGNIYALDMSEALREIEIEYSLGSKWWGKGIASEIVSAVVNFLFEEVGFDHVIASVHEKNVASIKVLEKLGFEVDHVDPGEASDGIHDLVVMRADRPDGQSIQVAAAIILQDGKVLATQRAYGNWAGYWEFPGGKMEPGETGAQAVIREIKEELNAESEVQRYFTTIDWDYPEFHVTMDCYLVNLLSDFKLLEHADCKWVDASNIDSLQWLPSDVEVVDQLKAQELVTLPEPDEMDDSLEFNSFLELAEHRFSCRKFDGRSVGPRAMDHILQAGRLAPTAKNLQGQRIYVVQSPEGLEKMDSLTPCRYGAGTVIMVAYDTEQSFTYPGGLVNSSMEDATIVATHMVLAAASIGVNSCWVNKFNPAQVKAEFGLPWNEQVFMLIPMGYAAEGTEPSPNHASRKDLSETVTFI